MKADVIRDRTLQKFDKDAPVYEQTSDGRFCARVYPDVIREINAAPFESLLDVGCGTGLILSEISTEKRRYGIDLSEQMITRAKEGLKESAELRVGDAESLPWQKETFDTVSCTFSFHHYPNPEKVLSEMCRVLKCGGRLIIADPWMPTPLRQIANWLFQYSKDGDFHSYSKGEIKRLLLNNGFALLAFKHPTHDTFLLTASKNEKGCIQNA